MPNNHSKYRIPGTIAGPLHPVLASAAPLTSGTSRGRRFREAAPPGRNPGPRRSRQVATTTLTRNGAGRTGGSGGTPPRVSIGAAAHGAAGRRPASSLHHGGARVYAPGAFAGKTLDFQALAAEKLFDGAAGLVRPDAGQDHVPVGRLEREGGQ